MGLSVYVYVFSLVRALHCIRPCPCPRVVLLITASLSLTLSVSFFNNEQYCLYFLVLYLNSLFHPQNRDVGKKLGYASAFMFTLPLLTYYVAKHVLTTSAYFSETNAAKNNADNWAGFAAIVTTNVIVAGYCYSAYVEDRDEKEEANENENDEDRPRVGIFKRRTD